MNSLRITSNDIRSLQPNEVFVFGSNVYGKHGSGAARTAYEKFGAKWGQGVGFSGQSYAIPTMYEDLNSIGVYINDFITFARTHQNLIFLVTPIGCGIAGYTAEQIAPLFRDAIHVKNIYLPIEFWEQINNLLEVSSNKKGNIVRIITIGSATQCDIVINYQYDYMMKNVIPVHCQIMELDNGELRLAAFGDVFVNYRKYSKSSTGITLKIDDCIYIGTMSNPIYWQQWFYNYGLNCNACKYSTYCLPNDEFCSLCKEKGYNSPPHIKAYSRDFRPKDKAELWGPCYQCSSNIKGFCKADNCFAKDACKVFEPINHSWKEHIAMYEERIKQYKINNEYEKIINIEK